MCFRLRLPSVLALLFTLLPAVTFGQFDIEKPPFNYSKTKDDNPVTRLKARIKSGDAQLEYDRSMGYLSSILKELDVYESTQALVFSKTSLQVKHISPRNPRAIYFNDDVYVGWVRGSDMMELSTSDPNLGAVFYTVTMSPGDAYIKRAGYDCLGCHATSMTQGIPGHTVRSVFPSRSGSVDPKQRSFVTDHTSAMSERWGGWYVTGLHGDMQHMGNAFLSDGLLDRTDNANRQHLRDEFQTFGWLSPYSDIVALMVLEHQTQMHNTFTRANFAVRYAKYDFAVAGETEATIVDNKEFEAIVAKAAADVVNYLLFADEAQLTSEVKGSVVFTEQFRQRGPSDRQGRSLRDFDLQSRLFRYPCSYLIYSSAFDSLDESLRRQVYMQLREVLTSTNAVERFSHLNEATRQAITQILVETKPELVSVWNDDNTDNFLKASN